MNVSWCTSLKPGTLKLLRVRYERQVSALLLQVLRNVEDTKEAFSDVLLKVWDTIGRYDEARDGGLGPWVRTIARNHALNVRRQQHRQRAGTPPPISLEEAGEPAAPPEAEPETDEADGEPSLCMSACREALSRLPQRYQDLLTLSAAGRTPKEIAELTGDPLVSVKLNQAATALLRELRRDGRVAAAGLELPDQTEVLGKLRELRDLRNLNQETEQHGHSPSHH